MNFTRKLEPWLCEPFITCQANYLRYDKKRKEHYYTMSALVKSMRASQADAVLYYLVRVIDIESLKEEGGT